MEKSSNYVSKKVPKDRTLTAVFDGYLDDILFPATVQEKELDNQLEKQLEFIK